MLSAYYQENNGKLSFTREQGSDFAKSVAGDYNPLHNEDSKRFCVPGDLLFSIVLEKYGISENMKFSFVGMVTEAVDLILPECSENLDITDGEKTYLSVERTGRVSNDSALIERLIKNYVEFSGTTFPHVIVPLMAKEGVMINPDRPMVMYQSMSIHLDNVDVKAPALVFADPVFDYTGKRGSITLPFDLVENDEVIGRGEKHMLVSGIKSYDEAAMGALIDAYNNRVL